MATTIAKVVTRTKTEAAVESLAQFVVDANLEVDDRLPAERELALALGVSRPVLREALKHLEALGVIEPRPGSGTYLRSQLSPSYKHVVMRVDLERESLIEMLELRRALESEAAAIAAVRASDEAVAELGALVDRLEDDFRRTGDNPESDKAFHMALYRLAGNRLFWDVIAPVWQELETFWQYPLGKTDFAKRTLPLHRELYERISARDPEGARKLVHRMLEIVEEDLRA